MHSSPFLIRFPLSAHRVSKRERNNLGSFLILLGLFGWDDGWRNILENSLEDVQRHSLNIACILLIYLELVDVGEVVNSAYAKGVGVLNHRAIVFGYRFSEKGALDVRPVFWFT